MSNMQTILIYFIVYQLAGNGVWPCSKCVCNDMICYNISIGNGVYPCSNCVCTEGYNGTTCDCPTSTDACTDNNGTICSDRGQCVCGKCVCDDNYQGEQCQECSTCPGQCKANQDCAECVGFKQGKLSESDCLAQCSHVTTEAVLPVENVTKCQFFDDEGCQIEFTYEYDEEFQLKVVVKDTKTAHGCDIFQKEIYAETGSAVILSCQISTEALTQSWRKDFLVLTRGFEMNRNLGGHERLTLIIDKWFYNLKIYNLTENDFGTYVCETQQGNSITEEVTKLIHSVTSTVILNEDTTTDGHTISFQSTLSDSSTSETKEGTGIGQYFYIGLFATGFVVLCLSVGCNYFLNRFARRKERKSVDNENQDVMQGDGTHNGTESDSDLRENDNISPHYETINENWIIEMSHSTTSNNLTNHSCVSNIVEYFQHDNTYLDAIEEDNTNFDVIEEENTYSDVIEEENTYSDVIEEENTYSDVIVEENTYLDVIAEENTYLEVIEDTYNQNLDANTNMNADEDHVSIISSSPREERNTSTFMFLTENEDEDKSNTIDKECLVTIETNNFEDCKTSNNSISVSSSSSEQSTCETEPENCKHSNQYMSLNVNDMEYLDIYSTPITENKLRTSESNNSYDSESAGMLSMLN